MALASTLVINMVNEIFQAFLTLRKSQGKAKFVYIFRIEVLLETITFARAQCFKVLIVLT